MNRFLFLNYLNKKEIIGILPASQEFNPTTTNNYTNGYILNTVMTIKRIGGKIKQIWAGIIWRDRWRFRIIWHSSKNYLKNLTFRKRSDISISSKCLWGTVIEIMEIMKGCMMLQLHG